MHLPGAGLTRRRSAFWASPEGPDANNAVLFSPQSIKRVLIVSLASCLTVACA